MNKSELVKSVAEKADLSRKDATDAVDAVFSAINEALSKDEAKAQIKEKRYGIRLSDKEVITLAIIIVNENKDEMHEAMREVAAIEEIL